MHGLEARGWVIPRLDVAGFCSSSTSSSHRKVQVPPEAVSRWRYADGEGLCIASQPGRIPPRDRSGQLALGLSDS